MLSSEFHHMIYIVIPVFNRKGFTKDCLDSLRQQTYQHFKVVIVDDGSTDGTYEMLIEEYPEVLVLKGNGSLWWTASVNLGIELALKEKADYVMTLNNDTLAREDFLEKMMLWAKREPDAILGASAWDLATKKLIYGGGNFSWATASIQMVLDQKPEESFRGLEPVDHFPGRGLLIPGSVFEKTGLFDAKVFPHYFADYDFTHRAHRDKIPLYCNFDAVLYTYPEESGDRENRKRKNLKRYYNHLVGIKGGGNLRNFTLFAFRHCPPLYLPFHLLAGYVRRIFGYFIR